MGSLRFWDFSGVSDQRLLDELHGLLGGAARMEARLIAHLAEVEERRLHLKAACSSLFDYCLRCLQLSESEAFHRITAARLAARYPLIFELLELRALHLSAVCLLRDHLTLENHAELLAAASHKSKREVLLLLAERAPRPDVTSRIRKLPERERAPLSECEPTGRVVPLSPERYRVQLNACAELKAKLERARALMSHVRASKDIALVIERGLDLLLAKLERERFAQVKRPRKQTSGSQGLSGVRRLRRRIPNGVRRAVFARDHGQCSYTDDEGRRCGAKELLQIHHDLAWARGGDDATDNLRLLCAPHNRLLAERDFGRAHVARAIAAKSAAG